MLAEESKSPAWRLAVAAAIIFAVALSGGWMIQQYFYQTLPKVELTLLATENYGQGVKPYSFNGTNPTITVKMGTLVKVALVNSGAVPHDFVVDELSVHINPHVEPSQRGSVVFLVNRAGGYTFYCSVPGHRDLGMEGQLNVVG